LLVEIELGQGKFNGLPDLLLLHVQTANVRISHIWLLVGAQHGNGGISFRGKDVDEGVGVAVKGDGGGGF